MASSELTPGEESFLTALDLDARTRDLEHMIRRIKDVISARVMLGADGTVEEIHVLASGGRNVKQLVRDVESTVMTQGTAVDHKKISIAQLTPETDDANMDRLKVLGITVVHNGRAIESRVKLQYRGAPVEGNAAAPATSTGKLRSLAEATLRAVVQCLPAPSPSLSIEDCHVGPVGQRLTASVVVNELDDSGERTLLGSCLVRQDESDAVVRATLDAINRRLALLQTQQAT